MDKGKIMIAVISFNNLVRLEKKYEKMRDEHNDLTSKLTMEEANEFVKQTSLCEK